MKPLIRIALSGIFLFGMTAGCKKSNNNTTASANGISATLNGTGFQSQAVIGVCSQTDSFVDLFGYRVDAGDTTSIEILIADTMHLNQPTQFVDGSGLYYVDTKSGIWFNGDPNFGYGTVTVTSWDTAKHTIAGTFKAVLAGNTVTDTMIVTNGRFNTTYEITP